MLNCPHFRPRPTVAIDGVNPVNLNEVYLSGLPGMGSRLKLNQTSLRWHVFANELRDAPCNILFLALGEKPSLRLSRVRLGFLGAPQILRNEIQCDMSRWQTQAFCVHSRGSRDELFCRLVRLLSRFVRSVFLENLRNFDPDFSPHRGYDKKVRRFALSQLAHRKVAAQVSKALKVLTFDFFLRMRLAMTL